MSRIYVVCQVGYEYNDEGYDREEGDGTPVRGFTDRASAEAYLAKQTLVRAKEWGEGFDIVSLCDLSPNGDYYYPAELSEVFPNVPIEPMNEAGEYPSLKELTDEEWDRLLKHLGIEFYVVREIEFE